MQENKYLAAGSEVLRQAKDYLSQPDWTHISKNKNGTILKKKDLPEISSIPCYLVETMINKPVNDLVSKIWDVDEMIVKKNDPEITSWKQIESGTGSSKAKSGNGGSWKVCQQTNSAPWPIWPRELAFSQVKIVEDDTVWLVAFSVDHPLVPLRDKEFVRAHIFMSIWCFTPENGLTMVRRIVHVEPRGLIPTWVVNATVNKHVDIIEKLGHR